MQEHGTLLGAGLFCSRWLLPCSTHRLIRLWVLILDMPNVLAEFDDVDEFERMRQIKDWNGKTWKDVIRRGIGTLEDPAQIEQ